MTATKIFALICISILTLEVALSVAKPTRKRRMPELEGGSEVDFQAGENNNLDAEPELFLRVLRSIMQPERSANSNDLEARDMPELFPEFMPELTHARAKRSPELTPEAAPIRTKRSPYITVSYRRLCELYPRYCRNGVNKPRRRPGSKYRPTISRV
ncbi:uncharacterized protein LOC141909019 [Tubulanus polymorphus]|uniref:uncharacterized protein LOC141909019 n=1 Tax=Tubulanus polymorphus TaxID=672921 RepID=UPI003DA64533